MANIKRDPGIYPMEHKDNLAKCRKWKIVLTVDYKQVSRTTRGTLTDARKAKEELRRESESGIDFTKASLTFAEYATIWSKRRADSGNYSPATITNDKTTLNKFLPLLGKQRIGKIQPHAIIDALQAVKDTPKRDGGKVSNTYMQKLYTTLNTLFIDAVREEVIAKNPMDKVEKPKRDTKERDTLSADRYAQLFTEAIHAEPTPGNNAIALALGFGLRRGECLGLRWGDVDFTEGTVTVRQSLDARTGKPKAPKTKTSRRTVPAIDGTMDYLARAKAEQRRYLSALGIEQTQETPVCITPTGGYLYPTSFYYQFRQWAKAHNLDIVFHELRHTYASMLCANGVDIITASKLMGHSDTDMLAKIYAHVLDENKRAAAMKLSKMVARQMDKSTPKKMLKVA